MPTSRLDSVRGSRVRDLAFLLLLWCGAGCTEDPGDCRFPSEETRGPLRVERVFEHAFPDRADLNFAMQLAQSPADPERWYVAVQLGTVLMFSSDPDVPGHSIALDLAGDERLALGPDPSGRPPGYDERGIISLSLHPSGGFAFLTYTSPPTQSGAVFDSRVSRFMIREDGTFDPDSERVLFSIPQPGFPHSGNHSAFGPDGLLYVSVGDGGGVGDPHENGQNPNTLAGAILRVDVDSGDPYAIPASNPFVDGGGAPEVFAFGLRNPWRFSFDRETGDLWAGDVGQHTFEEVNVVRVGENYGWPIREGFGCYEATECIEAGLTAPRIEYGRDEGRSVVGGIVYRGSEIPELIGRYVYADFDSGNVFSVDAEVLDDEPRREFSDLHFGILSYAQRADGELFHLRWSPEGEGGIYRYRRGEPTSESPPQRLSETGCFEPGNLRRPVQAAIPYAPTAELWSDGATKDRFIYMPPESRIDVEADGDFLFPAGTVLIKQFGFDGDIHETRILHRRPDGWSTYSYRWNEDRTDAVLLGGAVDEVLANGTRWLFPSPSQCRTCHTDAAGFTLGPEWAQLAGTPAVDELSTADAFDATDMERLSSITPLASPSTDGPTAPRARAYLHANCSGCHRPGGTSQADFDLRITTPLADTRVCDVRPRRGTVGHPMPDQARIVAPGSPADSVIALRMRDLGGARMPPLGTHVVDEVGVELIEAWIRELENCP